MSFLQGVNAIDANFTRTTGTIIRFRSRQLAQLPLDGARCTIVLPDGTFAPGKFKRNAQNPNIAGPELRRWIRTWMPHDGSVPILLVEHQPDALEVTIDGASPERESARRGISDDLRSIGSLPRDRRRIAYSAWERNPRLRTLALATWGAKCQVQGCVPVSPQPLGGEHAYVEVHHLNHVGTGGIDSPLNICLLCASHHALVHGMQSVLTACTSTFAEIDVSGCVLRINRNTWETM